MGNIIVKLMVGFASSLLTQKLFNKLAFELMWYGAQLTEIEVDDRWVFEAAKANGVDLAWPKKDTK